MEHWESVSAHGTIEAAVVAMSYELLADKNIALWTGNCVEVLKLFEENSYDACICDPPYELGFMGKSWDDSGVAFQVETWRQVFRVLKPGAHLVAFSGTRTYHRMVCAIEDAGFEIRDQIGWTFGQGFPKSLNISKAIDKAAGVERKVIGSKPTVHRGVSSDHKYGFAAKGDIALTTPATTEAQQWEGWGTALKPAWEPVVLARKPLSEKTVAANVLRWGTGGINVDGCRIEAKGRPAREKLADLPSNGIYGEGLNGSKAIGQTDLGRWPANLVHDGSEEVLGAFPESKDGIAVQRHGGGQKIGGKGIYQGSEGFDSRPDQGYGGKGTAARFFYHAKASKRDRCGSKHPTVKPVDLMQWLVRLVTPPGGVILDPFAGTGTTGEAAINEGARATLIEMTPEYQEDIRRRFSGTFHEEETEQTTGSGPGTAGTGRDDIANDDAAV